jgi:hypothetical protein
MKIFKELKKLGYMHYSATTIEELDDLPLNSAERVSEQALVLRWFREKYILDSIVQPTYSTKYQYRIFNVETKSKVQVYGDYMGKEFKTYEEAELACLIKLIEIVKNK